MKTSYMKYILMALSVVVGFAMCIRYSLLQDNQDDLWLGLLMITAVPVGLYMVCDSWSD